ncbi:glutaredoxin 3 [Ensifer sp. ENS10]|uniref:glutaredoxin domain-containing protein n=1 Tax=Ensifer sp. ENS10 TaxID=2769286 RepID=UPI001784DE1E|nr:glutaredoxin domain-containing protein [Ensifer sp. ENS10]MBD9511536.1 glutaredoxin 3 [Ensifer sp. ENS10]
MSWVMMTKPGCNYCTKAKALLKSNNISFSVSDHDTPEKVQRFKDAGYTTFPQIFHDGVRIGGFDDLEQYLEV